MSYSPPSGLTSGTIQISRLFTMFCDPRVGAVVVAELAQQVQRHLDGEVLAGVLVVGEQDLGLGLVGRRRCR